MTQPDGWQSPYDPPQQNDPQQDGKGPVPGPTPAPGQAGPPSPYQQPYGQPDPQQTYPQQAYPQQTYPQPYQQPAPLDAPYQSGQHQPGQYQPQPQYGAYYGYTPPPEKNALGVWSLVLGILSVVMLFSCFVGFLAAIPAIITGHLSRRAQKEGLANNGGLGLGGIITGWVTIGLTVLAIAGIAILFSIPEFREGFSSESTY